MKVEENGNGECSFLVGWNIHDDTRTITELTLDEDNVKIDLTSGRFVPFVPAPELSLSLSLLSSPVVYMISVVLRYVKGVDCIL